jgi:hypothetical protein
MAKILKSDEVLKALNMLADDIDCMDAYTHFIEDLSEVLADHGGGEFVRTRFKNEADYSGLYSIFKANECLPSDGGVFKHFDTDVTWKDGVEI